MDTIRKIRKLKHKRSKTNAQLIGLAQSLGVTINNQDQELLRATRLSKAEEEACEDARERLLTKLDSYQANERSKFSRTLALIGVVLSIISALLSIYASVLKT